MKLDALKEEDEVDTDELALAFEGHLEELGEDHPAAVAFHAALAELLKHRTRVRELRKRILEFTMATDEGQTLEQCVGMLELDCTAEYEQRQELATGVVVLAEQLTAAARVT